jgi:hypothetical protein
MDTNVKQFEKIQVDEINEKTEFCLSTEGDEVTTEGPSVAQSIAVDTEFEDALMLRLETANSKGMKKAELKDKLVFLCDLEKEKRLEDTLECIPEDKELRLPKPEDFETPEPEEKRMRPIIPEAQ